MYEKSCASSNHIKSWKDIDFGTAEYEVKKLQMRIAKAVKENRVGKIKSLQWTLTHSFYAKAIAVKRVTENKGKDNLEYVIGRIRILRFAVNYGYLLTDKDMQMEVDTLATTLSAVFLSPEIGPVIKHALLLAWAYGESLTDVKTLLAGKKVPAVKSKESWNLTLDGLLELAKNRSIPEGKETEEGNSYEQYLQMMLVLKSKEELSMRALDLVEINLRSGMEKTFFRADACVSGADFDMTCYLRRGIRYQYHILYQYQ